MPANASNGDGLKYAAALIVAVIGLIIPAVLVISLAWQGCKSNEVSTVVGSFTTVVGTLVGAFLGVQVGSAGKQKAESIARRALAALPPAEARQIAE
jgi:hypothetical protein